MSSPEGSVVRVLLVEDDASHRETLERHLARTGHSVVAVESAEKALNELAGVRPDIVVTDVRLPGIDGFGLLRKLKEHLPDVHVVMLTGYSAVSSAIEAIKNGAFDFLLKPLDLDELDAVMERCVADRIRGADEPRPFESDDPPLSGSESGIVGTHPRMLEVYKRIGAVSRARMPVLITGETGTGKEVVARAIHRNSPERDAPFVAVNCAAVPDTLLESELFGHMKGAFTGATSHRKGRFELAGSGTILLDEIGDTSGAFQSKLLRVVQERRFYPVGGEELLCTGARIVAATHQPLPRLVEEGRFREDLFFRLRVVEIELPPLRERRSDIPTLVDHILTRVCGVLGRPVPAVPRDVLAALIAHDWPGNVRELENTLTRAVVFSRGSVVTPDALFPPGRADDRDPDPVGARGTLQEVERRHVQHVLLEAGGNKSRTARILGISRPRLDRMIERYDLIVD